MDIRRTLEGLRTWYCGKIFSYPSPSAQNLTLRHLRLRVKKIHVSPQKITMKTSNGVLSSRHVNSYIEQETFLSLSTFLSISILSLFLCFFYFCSFFCSFYFFLVLYFFLLYFLCFLGHISWHPWVTPGYSLKKSLLAMGNHIRCLGSILGRSVLDQPPERQNPYLCTIDQTTRKSHFWASGS